MSGSSDSRHKQQPNRRSEQNAPSRYRDNRRDTHDYNRYDNRSQSRTKSDYKKTYYNPRENNKQDFDAKASYLALDKRINTLIETINKAATVTQKEVKVVAEEVEEPVPKVAITKNTSTFYDVAIRKKIMANKADQKYVEGLQEHNIPFFTRATGSLEDNPHAVSAAARRFLTYKALAHASQVIRMTGEGGIISLYGSARDIKIVNEINEHLEEEEKIHLTVHRPIIVEEDYGKLGAIANLLSSEHAPTFMDKIKEESITSLNDNVSVCTSLEGQDGTFIDKGDYFILVDIYETENGPFTPEYVNDLLNLSGREELIWVGHKFQGVCDNTFNEGLWYRSNDKIVATPDGRTWRDPHSACDWIWRGGAKVGKSFINSFTIEQRGSMCVVRLTRSIIPNTKTFEPVIKINSATLDIPKNYGFLNVVTSTIFDWSYGKVRSIPLIGSLVNTLEIKQDIFVDAELLQFTMAKLVGVGLTSFVFQRVVQQVQQYIMLTKTYILLAKFRPDMVSVLYPIEDIVTHAMIVKSNNTNLLVTNIVHGRHFSEYNIARAQIGNESEGASDKKYRNIFLFICGLCGTYYAMKGLKFLLRKIFHYLLQIFKNPKYLLGHNIFLSRLMKTIFLWFKNKLLFFFNQHPKTQSCVKKFLVYKNTLSQYVLHTRNSTAAITEGVNVVTSAQKLQMTLLIPFFEECYFEGIKWLEYLLIQKQDQWSILKKYKSIPIVVPWTLRLCMSFAEISKGPGGWFPAIFHIFKYNSDFSARLTSHVLWNHFILKYVDKDATASIFGNIWRSLLDVLTLWKSRCVWHMNISSYYSRWRQILFFEYNPDKYLDENPPFVIERFDPALSSVPHQDANCEIPLQCWILQLNGQLNLEHRKRQNFYLIYCTNAWGAVPARNNYNLYMTVMTRIMAAPPCDPNTQFINWRDMPLFIDQCPCIDDLDEELIKNWLVHFETSVQRKRYLRLYDMEKNCMIPSTTDISSTEIFMKGDECLFKYKRTESGLRAIIKPRPISFVNAKIQYRVGPFTYKALQQLKEQWGINGKGFNYKKIIFHFYYAGCSTDYDLSVWLKYAMKPTSRKCAFVAISGDDSLVLFWNNYILTVYEADASMFDQSQSTGPLFFELVAWHKLGIPEHILNILSDIMVKPLRAYSVDKDGDRLEVLTNNRTLHESRPMRFTGGPNTSGGNSIIMAHSWAYSLANYPNDPLKGFVKLGFEMKLKTFDNIEQASFLKGMFYIVDHPDFNYFWAPLISRFVKMGKCLRNPCTVYKIKNFHEASRRYLSDLSQSYAYFMPLPLIRTFVKHFRRIEIYNPDIARIDSHKVSANVTVAKPILNLEGLHQLCSRYDIDPEELLSLEMALPPEPFIFIQHQLFLKLVEKDYS